jgi:hypothetical protein
MWRLCWFAAPVHGHRLAWFLLSGYIIGLFDRKTGVKQEMLGRMAIEGDRQVLEGP